MARKKDDKDLLGIWQEATGQGDDGLRSVMETVIQRILEEELMSFLQAESQKRASNLMLISLKLVNFSRPFLVYFHPPIDKCGNYARTGGRHLRE